MKSAKEDRGVIDILNEQGRALAVITEQNKTLCRKLDTLEAVIRGDGSSEGMYSIVRRHDLCYKQMHGNGKEGLIDVILRNSLYLKLLGVLASAGLVVLGGLIIAFVSKFF